MIAGGTLSDSKILTHFILISVLFLLVIIEWAFQLSFFNKMSPYYSKGGPISKTTYFVTLFVWLFNLVGIGTLISNIIIYFIVYYIFEKKGKDTTSLRNAMNILAKVCFAFLITSAVFGILVSIVGIMPDLGAYSENTDDEKYDNANDDYPYNLAYDDYDDYYGDHKNKFTNLFLTNDYNNKICSMAIYEILHKYGKRHYESKDPSELEDEENDLEIWLYIKINYFKGDFSPICNNSLLPMMVLCFIVMVYGSVCKCSHNNHAKEGVSNESSGQQQNPNQQGYPPPPGGYPNQQGYPLPPPGWYPPPPGWYPPPPPGGYPNQQGCPPPPPGGYPNQQGCPPPPPGGYPPPPPGWYPNQQGGYTPPPPPGGYPNQQNQSPTSQLENKEPTTNPQPNDQVEGEL